MTNHINDVDLYQILNPGNYEELKKYELIDIFTKDDNNNLILVKPADKKFNNNYSIIIKDDKLINLYIRIKDRINLIRNQQNQLNVELKKSLKIDIIKARTILTNLVEVTLSDPRSDLLNEIRETIDVMIQEYLSNPEVIKHLVQISIHDYSTSLHVTNCMLFCFGYAHYCKFDKNDMKELGLAALLHDIGKLEIPDYLLQASRKLSMDEFEIIKTHTTKGFSSISNSNLSNKIKLVTLEHHERIDGSGYPYGRKNIQETSKIIGLIDVFEALTNWRPYKDEMNSLDALSYIKIEGVDLGKFDAKIFKNFAQSLVGMRIT